MGNNEKALLAAFIIWGVCGLGMMGMGIYAFTAKKPVGFWANAKTVPMADVKSYNRAVGKLWCVYGVIFILLGLPMFPGQNTALILFSVIGVMFESIAMMIIYTKIEAKYRKK